MGALTIYETTKKRLTQYHLFSDKTINTVAALAQKQAEYTTYQDFFNEVGIPALKLHVTKKGRGVPYVDVAPKQIKTAGVIVMHLPMGNALDSNQLYQVATIAAIHPAYRVIAFGNPSSKPFAFKQQNLRFKDRLSIAFLSDKSPLVDAELDYLQSEHISKVYHLGYSYGATKSLLASYYAKPGTVKGVIAIEPVAHPRYLRQLVRDFASTVHGLEKYVTRTQLQTFFDARNDVPKIGRFNSALKRQINIAIGFMLARTDFIALLEKVLEKQPKAAVAIAWGSESELGNDAHMQVSLERLNKLNNNIYPIRLADDKHALANDVHLHAAIAYEALNTKFDI